MAEPVLAHTLIARRLYMTTTFCRRTSGAVLAQEIDNQGEVVVDTADDRAHRRAALIDWSGGVRDYVQFRFCG